MAALCDADLEGGELGSRTLVFRPTRPVRAGDHLFDIAEARSGGSAGAASLVVQTAALPLAFAKGRSSLTVRGGTHVPWSPPFDYLLNVWAPTLQRIGIEVCPELHSWGWYPIGQGEVCARIPGRAAGEEGVRLNPLDLRDPGRLLRVTGRAVAANLPRHIAERMSETALSLTARLGAHISIPPECVQAACAGAGIFLTAEYEHARCGFGAIGTRGKPAERVAEEAVQDLLRHHKSGAALDPHLSDQILLPLAFSEGPSRFSTDWVSQHLESNAWVIERFGLAEIEIERRDSGVGTVIVSPRRMQASQV